MSILEIQSTWRLKSKSLNLFSRVLVPLAAEDPLVVCAAMTTSVQRYQEYCRSIWDLRNEQRKNLDHNNPNSDLKYKGERDRLLVDESRHRCLRGFSD